MNTFTLVSTTYLCTLATLILICAPGLVLYNFFAETKIRPKPLSRITASFVVGFSILVTIFFFAGKFGTHLRSIMLLFLVLSLLSLTVIVVNSKFRILLAEFKLLAIASLIGVWQFLPGIKLAISSGVGMNMVTLNNNDIAYYAGAATEFLESGFHSSGHIASVDPNIEVFAAGYHSPFALISFMASTF